VRLKEKAGKAIKIHDARQPTITKSTICRFRILVGNAIEISQKGTIPIRK
jgi:hypothetical protein